jgi:hypothetical protein
MGTASGIRSPRSLRLDCGNVSVYCTPKTNSLGCVPGIAGAGFPSASATAGFDVTCANVRNNKSGLLFYGISGGAALPFQAGTLCVAWRCRAPEAVLAGTSITFIICTASGYLTPPLPFAPAKRRSGAAC